MVEIKEGEENVTGEGSKLVSAWGEPNANSVSLQRERVYTQARLEM
jgi:hypothetical protein